MLAKGEREGQKNLKILLMSFMVGPLVHWRNIVYSNCCFDNLPKCRRQILIHGASVRVALGRRGPQVRFGPQHV